MGSLYSGLGVNIALRSDNYIGYAAAGCLGAMSSPSGGWDIPCGLAVGWLQTDLLTKENNRHGIGLYAGPVGFRDDNRNIAVYGPGITYEYFLEGVNNKGWNFGTTLATERKDGKTLGTLFINAGYQF